jgi:hypothetical protein
MVETINNGKVMGNPIADHTHHVSEIVMHPAGQVTTGVTAFLANWGVTPELVQMAAGGIAIVFGSLQIYVVVKREWFSRKMGDRRKGD